MLNRIQSLIGTVLDRNLVEKTKDGYKTKESVGDLSIQVWKDVKEHSITKMMAEIVEAGVKCGLTFANEMEKNFFIANPYKNITDNKQRAFLGREIASITDSHKFDVFRKKCSKNRDRFFSGRGKYFIYGFIQNNQLLSSTLPWPATDAIIERWFDKTFEKDIKKSYFMVYEDITGQIKEILTGYMDIKYHPETDSIETAPLTRYVGVNSTDNLMCKSFYDKHTKSWVSVPIRLIISVESEHGEDPQIAISRPPEDEDDEN